MKLVPLMQLTVYVDAPTEIGKTPVGTRRIFNAVGGRFEGDRLRGEVRPGGGEWFLEGEGGLGQVDVRLLLQTEDGAPIYLRYSGVMEFNERVGEALGAGRSTEYGDNLFLTQVRFECSDSRYAWLSRAIAVGEGRMHPDRVEYSIYEATHG